MKLDPSSKMELDIVRKWFAETRNKRIVAMSSRSKNEDNRPLISTDKKSFIM
jgi:hypothetical protein